MANILLVGDNGAIRRTTNYGGSWTVPYSGAHSIISICPAGSGVVFALALDGYLFKSLDDGQNWTDLGYKVDPYNLSKLVYLGNNTLVTTNGFDSDLLRSTDSGVTWTALPYITNYYIGAFCEGFVSGEIFIFDSAGLSRSTDYGDSFTLIYPFYYSNVRTIGIKKTGDGYLIISITATWHYPDFGDYYYDLQLWTYNSYTSTVAINVLASDAKPVSTPYGSSLGAGLDKVLVDSYRSSNNRFRGVSPYSSLAPDTIAHYIDYGYLSSYLFAIDASNVYASTNDGTSYTTVYSTGSHICVSTYNTLGIAANFTGTPTSGVIGTSVQFTDASVGATSWDWDYGDGSTHGTTQNPAHVYSVAGTYTVVLSINSSESVYTRTDYITIIPAAASSKTRTNYITVSLHADFSGDVLTGPTPLLTQFIDTSLGVPTSWEWDFGDGSSVIRSQNPHHYYMQPGTYTVTLTIYRGALSATITKTAYITVPDYTLDFVGTPLSGEPPLSVLYTDTTTGITPTSVSWDFGDGGTGTGSTSTHVYNDAGTFSVEMTVRIDP